MKVPNRTKQGNQLDKAINHFLRPTPEYIQGWESETGRRSGSRIVFNPKTLKHEICYVT